MPPLLLPPCRPLSSLTQITAETSSWFPYFYFCPLPTVIHTKAEWSVLVLSHSYHFAAQNPPRASHVTQSKMQSPYPWPVRLFIVWALRTPLVPSAITFFLLCSNWTYLFCNLTPQSWFLPQGLCTCCPLYLQHFPSSPSQGWFLHALRVSVQMLGF